MLANKLVNAHISATKEQHFKQNTPETMSDKQIKRHLCPHEKCKSCECLTKCLWGQQCVLRKLQ